MIVTLTLTFVWLFTGTNIYTNMVLACIVYTSPIHAKN